MNIPASLLVVSACCIIASAAYDLTVLHTNDVHGRVDEAHKYGGICSPEQSADGDCVGGSSRLYTKIKEVRNSRDNVLLLDGGDQFQGTFWFHVYHGQAAAQFMKKLEYDAMAIGNHEFDMGLPTLQEFINNVSVSVDVVNANIDNSVSLALTGFKQYIIKEVGGRKIGIIGYTTTNAPALNQVGNTGTLIFNDIIDSTRKAVADIKSNDSSVNIFIAVGHAGFEMDKRIGREVEDIDVVVGGHTNTFLYTGDPPASEKPVGDYPYIVTKPNGKTALCVQAYTFSKYLGNLTITFDDDGEITESGGNPILLDNSVAKDAEVEAMLAPYRAEVEAEGNIPIAEAVVTLDGSCRQKECNLGNLVVDAWMHSNIISGTSNKWARAAIALMNGGSVRSPIEKGNITNQNLLGSMPFGNDVVIVTVNGQTLKSVFERSAKANDDLADSGGFLQMSGARVKYNLNNPVGQRVLDLKLRCLYCDIPKYEPVDMDTNYTILTTTFLAGGGDGYSMFVTERIDYTNLALSDSAMVGAYMRTLGVVYPMEEGRIQFLTTPTVDCPVSSATVTKPGFNYFALIVSALAFILFK